jgi:hypothetical protein
VISQDIEDVIKIIEETVMCRPCRVIMVNSGFTILMKRTLPSLIEGHFSLKLHMSPYFDEVYKACIIFLRDVNSLGDDQWVCAKR